MNKVDTKSPEKIISCRSKGIESCCGVALLYEFIECRVDQCLWCGSLYCVPNSTKCSSPTFGKTLREHINIYYNKRVTLFMATIISKHNSFDEDAIEFWSRTRAALVAEGFKSNTTFINANSGNTVEVLYLDLTDRHIKDGHYATYDAEDEEEVEEEYYEAED